MRTLDRRSFLGAGIAATATLSLGRFAPAAESEMPFKISLAQWSLHTAFFGGKLDPMNFAKISKDDFGIDAIEYVNQFYKDKKGDDATLKALKKSADDAGVKNVLIMCDGEGDLGDPDDSKRKEAVDNHKPWLEWAKELGCHSIRVNARSKGTPIEQMKLAADGLAMLTEVAAPMKINVIVENHGGLSSNGTWLAAVIQKVDSKFCGTLPDFGNFHEYDRYKGVNQMMPFAKGVSAKSHDFDEEGNETHTDYDKMMQIVCVKHDYHGYVGIEYEGKTLPEPEGIKATKKLLERIRTDLAKK